MWIYFGMHGCVKLFTMFGSNRWLCSRWNNAAVTLAEFLYAVIFWYQCMVVFMLDSGVNRNPLLSLPWNNAALMCSSSPLSLLCPNSFKLCTVGLCTARCIWEDVKSYDCN
jgi:hypothetical protein